jgi:hypothetical protein
MPRAVQEQSTVPAPAPFSRRRIVIIAVIIVTVSALFWAGGMLCAEGGMTPWGTTVGGDFPAFYVTGQILRDSGPLHLYDRPMQTRRFHELIPRESPRATLPFAYPPALALVMSPLARLAYPAAAAAWAGISLAMYAAGLGLLWRTCTGIPVRDRVVAALLSLAFEPFIVECIHGGQLSAIGFFAVCLALALHRAGKPLAAGMALGLLAFKPTLLLALLPALALGRQRRMLAGVTATVIAGAVVGVVALGTGPSIEFVKLMFTYVHTVSAGDGFPLTKYVDVCAFLKLLWRRPDAHCWPAAILGVFVAGALAGRAFRSGNSSAAWITMLMGLLVCNLYAGIYDSVLAAAALWVMADVSYRRDGRLSRDVRWLIVATFIAPWITQSTARYMGVQIYTLVLAAAAAQPMIRRFGREPMMAAELSIA